MSKTTKTKTTKAYSYLYPLVLLVVGFSVGYLANNPISMKPASAQEIEQAKSEITKLYQGKTVDACWRVNKGENLATGKYELTYRNLRINQHANRAIVSDCSDFDTLLYKNKAGQWARTNVNLQIGNRVNPVWQQECDIEDITVADDTVRPENSSIDEINLEECKQINQL